MNKTKQTISLVIPAYNEQEHLAACLDAISRQTVTPIEVIVVDNNSTDATASIANSFPFVSLIKLKQRGVVYARDTGFDFAKGQIIGRIDADTILPVDWVEKVGAKFSQKPIDALSGSLHFYDIGWSSIVDSVEFFFRKWMAKKMAVHNKIFLLGANMAIRKSAWEKVKNSLCHGNELHEDLDLALHMSDLGLHVGYESDLLANVSARRVDSSFWKLFQYCLISPRTYRHHGSTDYFYMYPLIAVVLVNYLPLRMLYRMYDAKLRRINFRQLFSSTATRINPVTLS